MAATTAANQLKLEEMESACTMLLFVKGFTIAVLARTMKRESSGKSNTMCPSATLSGPDWVVVGQGVCIRRLGPVCLAVDHSSIEQSPGSVSTVSPHYCMP